MPCKSGTLPADAGQQSQAPEAVKVEHKSTDRHQITQADPNILRQTQAQTGKWASGRLDKQASLDQTQNDMTWHGIVQSRSAWHR